MKPDYYLLLDLRPEATAADIKRRFRELAKQYHPDKNPGDTDAEERFKLINEAYEQLRDPEKRAVYDRYVHRLQKKRPARKSTAWYDDFHPVDRDLRDFLRGFHGGGRASGSRRKARGADLRFNLKVAFHEAMLGCRKEIRLPITAPCPRCGGAGVPAGARRQRCAQCHGSGRRSDRAAYRRQCQACRGTGRMYVDTCRRCSGSGTVESFRSIEVSVPPGVETGTRLHLKGLGKKGPGGGRAGDFCVVVHVTKHPLLKVEEGRLVCFAPIPVYRALVGGRIEVPTLEDSVTVDVPPGVCDGQEIRLRAQGMRSPDSGRRSDLIVRFVVEMPAKMSAEEKKLIRRLAEKTSGGAYPQTRKYERALAGLKKKAQRA